MRHNVDSANPQPVQFAAPDRRKGATIAILAAMLVIHNAQRMGVVPLFPALRERFATDYAGVGTLFAAYVFGYAVFQAIVGLVGDRYNAKHLLLAGLLLSALFSGLFATLRSFQLALAVRFLLGVTGALLYTPAMKLGITLFAREERGRVLGILQAGAGLGIVGALTLVPFGATRFGVTAGLLALSVSTVAVLVLAVVLLPDDPRLPVAPVAGRGAGLAQRGDFWTLLLVSFSGMLASYGLLTWLPTYLTESFGYTSVRAGSLASLANVALLIAAPLVGRLADLPGGRSGVILGGSALAVGSFLVLVPGPPVAVVLGSTLLMGASLSATTAPLMLFAGERAGAGETARAVGWLSTTAQLGATLAGVVFGFLLTAPGRFPLLWLICALLALLRLALFGGLLWYDRLRRVTGAAVKSGI